MNYTLNHKYLNKSNNTVLNSQFSFILPFPIIKYILINNQNPFDLIKKWTNFRLMTCSIVAKG